MREAVRNYLNVKVTDWYQQGVIGEETRALLAARYDRKGGALGTLIKWLGFFAVYLLGSCVLSFIAAMAQSKAAAAVILFLAAGGSWYAGVSLVRRFPVPYTFTGSLLITVALAALYGALFLSLDASSLGAAVTLLYVVALAAAGTAYYYRLRWPLVLALLLFFHAMGSGHAYLGHGSYGFQIVDEKTMAVVALASILVGLFHETKLEEEKFPEYEGFGHLYIIFGLVYLNCSLWFLSLRVSYFPAHGMTAVLVFTACAIAQIIAGARLKDGRLTGFGVVFLAIDIYTRFFEELWDKLSTGQFFLAAGVSAMAAGYLLERCGREASLEVEP
jgi:hypothetical protein